MHELKYIKFGNGNKNFVIIPGLSIHSIMGLADAIKDAYKIFTEDYTVYVFDRKEDIKEGYSIKDMADDTAKAMKELGIADAYIFGVSQGGMIAQYIAMDYPKLVKKLILGSTLARPNKTLTDIGSIWVELARKKDELGLIESFVDNVYSEKTISAYRDVIVSSNLGITDKEYERFIILANACLAFNVYDRLNEIKCPVLVLGAKEDKIVTAKGSEEIADKLGCDIYLYGEGYGHGVYDEAEDYKKRCLDFFEK